MDGARASWTSQVKSGQPGAQEWASVTIFIRNMIDYYKELGVSPTADFDEIRRAYRSLAKQVHPDGSPHLTGQARADLERRFIQLARAYDILGDNVKRGEYDRKRRSFGTAESRRPGAGSRTRASNASPNSRTATNGFTSNGAASDGATRNGAARGRPRDDATHDAGYDDLFADAESLLRGFGLDLRQPFEQVLDTLMNWALRMYREIVAPSPKNPASQNPTPKNQGGHAGARTGTATRGGGRPSGSAKRGKPPAAASGRASKSPRRKSGHRAADVDVELAAIKSAVKKGRRAAAFVRGSSIDRELASLKRRRGPKR